MAPTGRYTAIPASLWANDSSFLGLSARAQWLYLRLWTSDTRNAAGFVPLQPTLWAKSSTTTSADTIKAAGDELSAKGWALLDFDAEHAWLCRFIGDDTFNSPLQYVSAMKLIRTCPSWMLRDAAWKEVQRLGLPLTKSEKMQEALDKAHAALQARMHANREGYREGIERVSKPCNDNDHAHDHEGEYEPNAETDDPPLTCANGCDSVAGPDGYCEFCVKARKW